MFNKPDTQSLPDRIAQRLPHPVPGGPTHGFSKGPTSSAEDNSRGMSCSAGHHATCGTLNRRRDCPFRVIPTHASGTHRPRSPPLHHCWCCPGGRIMGHQPLNPARLSSRDVQPAVAALANTLDHG